MERSFKTSTARASWHDQGPAGSVGRYRESGVESVEPVDRSSMLPRAYRLPQEPPSCRRSRAPSRRAHRREGKATADCDTGSGSAVK
jgi:hypothetical protein